MSTRHSFLSTTGLIRSSSSASTASFSPSTSKSTKSTLPSFGKQGKLRNFRNLKSLTLSTKPEPEKPKPEKPKVRGSGGVIPLGPTFIVGISIVISLFFIGSLSFAFIGAEDAPVFRDTLDSLADQNPGLVLIADNVDVDIDEPSVTLRWSVVACGRNLTLPGSEGTHGDSLCGIPNIPIDIYLDGAEKPEFSFNPAQLPFTSSNGHRLGIQNIVQFDGDHALDVHEARLYPFDTYQLATTLRAVAPDTSETIPIVRLLTITDTSSFIVSPSDSASYVVLSGSTDQLPSRDLELSIVRPGEARFFALMLFGVNWMLAHSTVAYTALAWKTEGIVNVLTYLALSLATLVAIPGVRSVMPDAPGYDGVLIDQIGFFAQMLLTGISTVVLLATLAKRELQRLEQNAPAEEFVKERPAPISKGLHKLRGSSTSVDFRHFHSLSRSFMGHAQPPTPIWEEAEPNISPNPFDARGKAPAAGFRPVGQSVGASASSTHLPSSKSLYSEWV
ncbi:uncharacterized protein PHACADRAFT_265076 [Phanerochaete carnosa HHB-10118-sp]|uniref:Uncharacterized protein n=1 Tax=Phanerochaete carnosa (strain HHB-10118-sp) TaxID=650164 RepID=K5VSJ4_PHACS|nr:uncharacterized protein PHACADRAFT_265076 [Phanerochaete carnosa HHB-10118-sp]EKM49539.1 hypothetical protein PHACADRAFT_265076 [Phanerochaete carnosa HHB-10118-sp]